MPKSKKKLTVSKAKIVKAAQTVKSNKLVAASKSQIRGFLDFIRTQGVVGLAVGLVLGGAVSVMVKSLVDNVVMPPIGILLGSAEGLKGLSWTMAAVDGKSAVLTYGIFLNDFVNFIIIALVVYFIVKLLRFDRLDKKKD